MRAVVQRVARSTVGVEGEITASIGKGLLVLLGVEEKDTVEDARWLASKIARLRIFSDQDGLMNLSVVDSKGELLVVSQFTLHASYRKGNRPSFIRAAHAEKAESLYEAFIEMLEEATNARVGRGIFGAMMEVDLVNSGPVTIFMDSKKPE